MRLIDADALMEKYGDWYTEEGTEEGYIGTVKGIVDSMPTIEPERKGILQEEIWNAQTIDAVPHWVPCEDGMPKKKIPYQRRDYYLTTNAYGNVDLTRYEFEDDFQKTGWQSDIRIVAWMQLPKPYAERKDHE